MCGGDIHVFLRVLSQENSYQHVLTTHGQHIIVHVPSYTVLEASGGPF